MTGKSYHLTAVYEQRNLFSFDVVQIIVYCSLHPLHFVNKNPEILIFKSQISFNISLVSVRLSVPTLIDQTPLSVSRSFEPRFEN